MSVRNYIVTRACTFRNREGGPARLYAKGDPMSVMDDDIKVPEDKFTLVKGDETALAAISGMNGDAVKAELLELGVAFADNAKVKDLKVLLKEAREGGSSEGSEGDDDILD